MPFLRTINPAPLHPSQIFKFSDCGSYDQLRRVIFTLKRYSTPFLGRLKAVSTPGLSYRSQILVDRPLDARPGKLRLHTSIPESCRRLWDIRFISGPNCSMAHGGYRTKLQLLYKVASIIRNSTFPMVMIQEEFLLVQKWEPVIVRCSPTDHRSGWVYTLLLIEVYSSCIDSTNVALSFSVEEKSQSWLVLFARCSCRDRWKRVFPASVCVAFHFSGEHYLSQPNCCFLGGWCGWLKFVICYTNEVIYFSILILLCAVQVFFRVLWEPCMHSSSWHFSSFWGCF